MRRKGARSRKGCWRRYCTDGRDARRGMCGGRFKLGEMKVTVVGCASARAWATVASEGSSRARQLGGVEKLYLLRQCARISLFGGNKFRT